MLEVKRPAQQDPSLKDLPACVDEGCLNDLRSASAKEMAPIGNVTASLAATAGVEEPT